MSMMQCVCVLLLLVGITLADPTVFFMEKFETGEEQVVHEPLHDREACFRNCEMLYDLYDALFKGESILRIIACLR